MDVENRAKAVLNQNHTKQQFAVVQMMVNLAIPLWIVATTKCHLTKPSENVRKQEGDFAQKLNFSVMCVAILEVVVTIF